MPNDLTLNPDFVFTEKPSFLTNLTKFENGVEQRRAKWSATLRQWKLEYRNRTTTDRDTIRTLFNSKKGRFGSLTWTHPETGSTHTVRFLEDDIEFENRNFNLFDFNFTLQEIRA